MSRESVTSSTEWRPSHTIGILTGSVMGLAAGILTGWSASAAAYSLLYGVRVAAATIIPFSIFGLIFDYVWMKIPVVRFNRKCWLYWALAFPVCRIQVDTLTAVFNGLDVYEHLLATYSSLTVAVVWAIPMILFGLGFGYMFSRFYRIIFRTILRVRERNKPAKRRRRPR